MHQGDVCTLYFLIKDIRAHHLMKVGMAKKYDLTMELP